MPPAAAARAAAEYARLASDAPPGVLVAAAARGAAGGEDVARWEGVCFVRRGPYDGGAFRFEVGFPLAYPSAPPRLRITTEGLFHPEVGEDGAADVLPGGEAWNGSRHAARDVLRRLKRLLEAPSSEQSGSPRNAEAAAALRGDEESFRRRAAELAAVTLRAAAEGGGEPGEALRFRAWDDELHAKARDALLAAPWQTS